MKLMQTSPSRLAFSVLRVDAYLSLLVDHPPSVRYQEICISLPKSPRLWAAGGEDEWRSLQWSEPVGREHTLFCSLVHNVLDFRQRNLPYRLTEADHHLVLCSLQVGIWGAAHEGHSRESAELATSSAPQDSIHLWRTHLDLWRVTTEQKCSLSHNCFSPSLACTDNLLSSHSLILWHISALTLRAPLKLLQAHGCCSKYGPGMALTTRKNKARLRSWIVSSDARTAVWNGAQIARIVERESTNPIPTTRLLLNPLLIHGVLQSAIVICSYAYHTRACPVCTGGPPIDLVDLLGANDTEERLIKWKEHGEGLADFTPSAVPVCECHVKTIAMWFRGLLTTDQSAETEFLSFLRGLSGISR